MIRNFYIYWMAALASLVFWGDQASGSNLDLAETANAMRVWHSADGLPSDLVTAIVQTRGGFLWIGTSAGLVRFDGAKFTRLKLVEASTNSPTSITALCEDSDGRLWIGTQQNGLFQLFRGRLSAFSTPQGLLDDSVTCLEAGPQGQVWIGTKSGLNVWTGKSFQSFTTHNGLPDPVVTGVNVARSGTVWITTRVGMCRYAGGHMAPYAFATESQGRRPEYLGAYEDRQGNLWAFGDTYLINLAEGKRFNYFRSSESASVRIWSLCEGRDGRLWIGTSGRGLFCFEDNRFQPVILGENRWSFDVRAICEDDEGNLWLGTSGGGLVQLRPQSMQVLRAGQGLPAGTPTALALDSAGRVYVGMRGAGLFVGESGRFNGVGGSGLAVQNFITSVWAAADGIVWVGTLGGGLYGLSHGREVHFTTANGLADDQVLAVCEDGLGAVWAGTGAGTIHRYAGRTLTRFDTQQGLDGGPVTVLIPAATNGLWAGTQGGQVWRETNGKFTVVEVNQAGHPVLALHEGDHGRLWIGTAGGGLACVVNGQAMNWNSSNGLPSDVVAGVAEDGANNLWLVTGAGIYRINHTDITEAVNHPRLPLPCTLMSEARTGPPTAPFFGGTHTGLSPDGELWLTTAEGVWKVDTHQTGMSPAQFPVYLESVAFNGGTPTALLPGVPWSPPTAGTPLQTPVDLRSVDIHFTALSYVALEDIQFRHQLEGFDPDWVNDGGVRSVRYLKLPCGHYRFRVAARNAGGAWHEAAETLALVVPTPLYYQTWAILLYAILAVSLVTGVVRLVSHRRLRSALARLEQQQSVERERMRIARDMHDEMGSKLTKISFLSERAQMDAEATGAFGGKIRDIAQTSRDLLKTMDEIVWVVNPRNDTLENLVTYLSHYAQEYFQNTLVECDLRLPQDIPLAPLSSEVRHHLFLTFEEALNNVLKHSGATRVQVVMTVTAAGLEVQVTDNGRGFEVPPGSATPARPAGKRGGNGLKNMRQRLTDIGGECLVTSRPGAGTTVTVRLQLHTHPPSQP